MNSTNGDRPAKERPRRGGRILRSLLPIGLILLSVVAVVVVVAIEGKKRPERVESGDQAVLVDTITADKRTLNLIVHSQGTVLPRTETSLIPEVSGKIRSVSPAFIAGGFFRKGDVLLQIDPSDYETALKRAEAALASRRAKLADERARSEQALRDWRNLGRSGEPSDLVLRKPQLQDAIANVQAAEADVQKARRDLERTRISVPYDGLVKEKLADVGQYVTPGTRLGVTFAIDTAEVRLPLSSSDLAFLDLPSPTGEGTDDPVPVTLTADSQGATQQWSGQIIRTEGVVDIDSRVVYAVAQVVDPYGVLGQGPQEPLRIGTFVRAAIEGKAAEGVVVLPRHVLRSGNTVLVANEGNELEIRTVEVVRAEPQWVYLSSGVAGGEQVITTTLDAPIPGMELAINHDDRGGEGETGSTGQATGSGDAQ